MYTLLYNGMHFILKKTVNSLFPVDRKSSTVFDIKFLKFLVIVV